MNRKQALSKVINKIGSGSELARRLNVSNSSVFDWISGRRTIPARLVRKLVLLSEGEINEHDLRPDIFYDEFEEKKELRTMVA